jgi:hypothetical protein
VIIDDVKARIASSAFPVFNRIPFGERQRREMCNVINYVTSLPIHPPQKAFFSALRNSQKRMMKSKNVFMSHASHIFLVLFFGALFSLSSSTKLLADSKTYHDSVNNNKETSRSHSLAR